MKKRWISIALALLMVMSLLPFAASAAESNGLQYTIKDGVAIVTGYTKEPVGKLVIPETLGGVPVDQIEKQAFMGCKNLTEVVIPENLRIINNYAFCRSGLKKINIPEKCYWLCSYSLSETQLEELTVNKDALMSGYYALAFDDSLRTATITEGIPYMYGYLPDGVFQYCFNLESVFITDHITQILKDAFNGCINLKDVYYSGSQSDWDEIEIFSGNSFLTNATLHCNWEGPIPTPTPAPTAKPEVKNPFKDVVKDQYYYEPVLWAVNHDPQITAGTSATTFSPAATCTRGQVVTFLWRAAGCPEPQSTKNPFTDVKASDYFFKAVLWAAEKGITAGTSATTFAPGAPCTRAHVVTFLWRANEKPAASGKNPFSDVKDGEYYTNAVLWAVSKNITQGTSATAFAPANPCTRGQIVTFLYRDMK